MNNSTPKILWIDDEIDLLRPHILYLKEKGYDVDITTTGKEGLRLIRDQNFDLVLIDQFMPGDDGIETSVNIKSINPSVPIIMITKSEEEWLIDEAIYKKIDRLLIKPINPNQIYAACKQVLESANIFSEKSKNDYLSQFKDTEDLAFQASSVEEWWKIYTKFVKWQIDFDVQREESLIKQKMVICAYYLILISSGTTFKSGIWAKAGPFKGWMEIDTKEDLRKAHLFF